MSEHNERLEEPLPWHALPEEYQEFLSNFALLMLHHLDPDQVPEELARLALLADAEAHALLPPREAWMR